MCFHLEYGRTGLEIELPGERVVRTLAYKDARRWPLPKSLWLSGSCSRPGRRRAVERGRADHPSRQQPAGAG